MYKSNCEKAGASVCSSANSLKTGKKLQARLIRMYSSIQLKLVYNMLLFVSTYNCWPKVCIDSSYKLVFTLATVEGAVVIDPIQNSKWYCVFIVQLY